MFLSNNNDKFKGMNTPLVEINETSQRQCYSNQLLNYTSNLGGKKQHNQCPRRCRQQSPQLCFVLFLHGHPVLVRTPQGALGRCCVIRTSSKVSRIDNSSGGVRPVATCVQTGRIWTNWHSSGSPDTIESTTDTAPTTSPHATAKRCSSMSP